jgi:hypothetical protein
MNFISRISCNSSQSTAQYCTHFLCFFPRNGPETVALPPLQTGNWNYNVVRTSQTQTEIRGVEYTYIDSYAETELRIRCRENWFVIMNFKYHTSELVYAIQHDLRKRKHLIRVEKCSSVFKKPLFIISRSNTFSPGTVTERSKACTVFAPSEDGIMGSNPTQAIDGNSVSYYTSSFCG